MGGTAELLRAALPPHPSAPATPGLQPKPPGTGLRALAWHLPPHTGSLPHTRPPSLPGRLARAGLLSGDDRPPVTIPSAPAREAAKRELSKGIYHNNEPSLLLRALNHVLDWLEGLFSAASVVTPGGGLGVLVILLAVSALAALLWWRLGTPRRAAVATAPLFDDRPRSAAEHRASAEAHASQGHWTQAVQERMRAVMRALEERALLDPRPGRTADEAAEEAAVALPAHQDRLLAAAREFDDVTYGGRAGDETAYRRLSTLDDDLARTRPVLTASGTSDSGRP